MANPTVTFEAPLLADAVSRAARIAPIKGAAYDKAAGIMFKARHDHTEIIATDLDTTYRQRVAILTSKHIEDDEAFEWRLPPQLISSFLSSLPMGAGSHVTFTSREDSSLEIASGTTVAKMPLFRGSYPVIPVFEPGGMSEANDLAAKLASVTWATDRKAQGIKSGVNINGTMLAATDGYKLALVPCEAPVEEPVTISVNSIAKLLKQATDAKIRANSLEFQIMLDPETQVTTRIFAEPYVNYAPLLRDTFLGDIELDRGYWEEVLQRMLTVVAFDRTPHLTLTIGGGKVAMVMEAPTGERIQDEVGAKGDQPREVVIGCDPNYIISALQGVRCDKIRFAYGHNTDDGLGARSTLKLYDPLSGYEVHIAPKVDTRNR